MPTKNKVEKPEQKIDELIKRYQELGDVIEREDKTLVRIETMADIGFDLHEDRVKTLCEKRGIEYSDDIAKRTLEFTGSDETVDRHGDIIRVNGWDLENYKKNPVFVWAHDYSELPIGQTLDVWKEERNGRKRLRFLILFADETENPKAVNVFNLYKNKFLSAVSVGFMPKQITVIDDEEERAELGLGRWGVVHEKAELYELSAVPVPSNPNALQEALKRAIDFSDHDVLIRRGQSSFHDVEKYYDDEPEDPLADEKAILEEYAEHLCNSIVEGVSRGIAKAIAKAITDNEFKSQLLAVRDATTAKTGEAGGEKSTPSEAEQTQSNAYFNALMDLHETTKTI